VNISIPAGAVVDIVGNPNEASTSRDNSVTVDMHHSVVTINRAVGQLDLISNIYGPNIVFLATFDTQVFGFNESGVNLTSGTTGASHVAVTGTF
jgi:hypothetical protein